MNMPISQRPSPLSDDERYHLAWQRTMHGYYQSLEGVRSDGRPSRSERIHALIGEGEAMKTQARARYAEGRISGVELSRDIAEADAFIRAARARDAVARNRRQMMVSRLRVRPPKPPKPPRLRK